MDNNIQRKLYVHFMSHDYELRRLDSCSRKEPFARLKNLHRIRSGGENKEKEIGYILLIPQACKYITYT